MSSKAEEILTGMTDDEVLDEFFELAEFGIWCRSPMVYDVSAETWVDLVYREKHRRFQRIPLKEV